MKAARNQYLTISFVTLLTWELFMIFLLPENGSILKIIITSLLWVSIISNILYIYVNYNFAQIIFPKKEFLVFQILIFWNIINIIRSIIKADSNVLTSFGNPLTVLSLLIPLAFFFGSRTDSIVALRRFLLQAMKLSFILLPVFFINTNYLASIVILCSGYILLFPSIVLEKNKNLVIILFSVFITLLLSTNSRTTYLRVFLYTIPFIFLLLQKKINFPFSFKYTFIILLIPLYFVFIGFSQGNSIFKDIAETNDSELLTDTRTFLFEEVIDDLAKSENLIIGKGATASYFSNYFSNIVQVKNNRLTVEVGILAILLKGGIIAVVLNLLVFLHAIYLGYFKSKNVYSKILGYIILIHVVLLFAENIIAFNLYNFIIWFTVGVVYNKKFRLLSNSDIKKIIYE